MEWREIAPYAYIAFGVTAFCSVLGWKYAARYLRWVNRQLGVNWITTPAGFRTGGYVGTPWYDTVGHRSIENIWVRTDAEHRDELFFRNLFTLEYMVGRGGTTAMHYLVRGDRPEGRYSAEFSATFEELERHHSHLDVVLELLSRHIQASRASRAASDTLSALQHDRSYRGEARTPILLSSLDGTRVPTEPKEEPENHNRPRRLRVRKTK